ncbi:TonB-dependent receptor [Flavivirga aquimarina]|uniref:TonB-dependent receptor n=1 Tax=Flavivirga aquimarina TaxID=2027862 RepID=A0ABT8W6N8_9FLAO|nr:TonB-dependent receptor [Flavivirga aquimarina]MDO5968752.1 TonB-dependent receptor [Flavivirga aquimarina]
MKKVLKLGYYAYIPLKFDLKMKLTTLFLIVSLFQLQANESYAQKTKVTLTLENVSIESVLNKIESLTDFKFIYKSNEIDYQKIVSIKAKKERISIILKNIFDGSNTVFKVVDKQIILKKEPSQTPEKLTVNSSIETEIIQGITVSGTITDANNQPLPGANIIEKGTTNGTQTDFDGNFTIEVNNENATLIISFIGFTTQEVSVNGQSQLAITLKEDAAALDEVVVIGYGTVRKRDLTGSVSSVDTEETFAAPVSNLDQALQGRAAGVQVTTVNGAPGSGATIRIRGGNSITAGNEPLYVIDGFVGGGDLNTINPNDIESIEILKDASSTAIYGSRGANGVILITTKRGKKGKLSVNLKTSLGIQSLPRKVDVQNGAEFASFINTALADRFDLNNLPGEDTDWQEVLSRDAVISDHALSIAGGSEKTNYFVSFGALDQEGILKGSDFERYTLRTNIDNQLTKTTKLGVNLALTRTITNNSIGTSNLQAIIRADPLRPAFDEEGNFTIDNVGLDNLGPNLLADADLNTDETINNRILINTFFEAVIAKDFTWKSTLGGDFVFQKRDVFSPSSNPSNIQANLLASGSVNQLDGFVWINENTLNYNKIVGDHSFNALAGFTSQRGRTETNITNASQIPSDGVGLDALELAPQENVTINSSFTEFSLVSFLGRLNYNYKGKYLLTASFRRDGSSRLGTNNRYANFPSVALAWRVSDEPFLQNSSVISNLKLRTSYGLTGNQNVDAFSTLSSLNTEGTAILNQGLVVGAQQGTLANPDLKWETTEQFDFGLELGLFNNRLKTEIDVYYKKTDDLLLDAAVPGITGFASTLRNVGSLENKGIDVSITGVIINTEDFNWTSTLNISHFQNKVLDLGDVDFITTLELQSTPVSQLIEGEPVGTFVGAIYDGVDSATGEAIYRDLDGDGEFNPEFDTTVIGDANPDFFGGFTNTFRYKNFDMMTFFQFSSGNDIYNLDVFQVNGTQLNSYADLRAGVWSAANPDNATIPVIGSASLNRSNSLFLQDGSFLRFRTLQLGYSIPMAEKLGLNSFRVFATANNLFLVDSDDFLGFDPDTNSEGTNNVLRGIDELAYPQNRSFIMGIEVSF